jgi:hypothetical protein
MGGGLLGGAAEQDTEGLLGEDAASEFEEVGSAGHVGMPLKVCIAELCSVLEDNSGILAVPA